MIKIRTSQSLADLAESFLQMAKDAKQGNIPSKLAEKSKHAPKQQAKFWGFLNENLDQILVGQPCQLEEIVEEIRRQFLDAKVRAGKSASKLGKNSARLLIYTHIWKDSEIQSNSI